MWKMFSHGRGRDFLLFVWKMIVLYQIGQFRIVLFNDLIVTSDILTLALLHVERGYFSLEASTSNISARLGVIIDVLLCSSTIVHSAHCFWIDFVKHVHQY